MTDQAIDLSDMSWDDKVRHDGDLALEEIAKLAELTEVNVNMAVLARQADEISGRLEEIRQVRVELGIQATRQQEWAPVRRARRRR